MSTRKLNQAIQNLFQQVSRLSRSIAKGLTSWLLRGLLIVGRKPAFNRAGFVLPTTILLLLVVSVTVGSITYRTFTRTNESINERQQRVIYNAATPAIDRAKAKLEFLFDVQRDARYPGGVPRQSTLVSMMLNDNRNTGIGTVQCYHLPAGSTCASGYDPYTFPDETRINLADSSANVASTGPANSWDNAWSYPVDLDGDGATNGVKDGVVAYSIIFQTPADINTLKDTRSTAVGQRANSLLVRQGPLSAPTSISASCSRSNSATTAQLEAANTGWLQDGSTATLRKNFQVDAFVLPKDPNGTVATLEFNQDRQIDRGNKWGAWFRNDLEVFPGPPFNWNGAMHTEGNLIIGDSNSFTGYLISAQNSCFYTPDASQVTVTNIDANPANDIPAFQGQIINGSMKLNTFSGSSVFHLFDSANGNQPITSGSQVAITSTTDSLQNVGAPADYSIDPVVLLTTGNSQGRVTLNPQDKRDAAWASRTKNQETRLFNKPETPPYVDDSYRADDRYGPKPKIGTTKIPHNIGVSIGTSKPEYTRNDPPSAAQSTEFGLDGYWERRARYDGMRLIVGQRLELGDAFGWGQRSGAGRTIPADPKNEPLRPWGANGAACTPNNSGICNEARQRRSLYDNLAAVQATAVYHSANFPQNAADKDFPVACLATTVHPGTPFTLEQSATFDDLNYDVNYSTGTKTSTSLLNSGRFPSHSIISDFFHGKGTNGWEYEVPTVDKFSDPNSILRRALKNLAYFAGDPTGGMPSFSKDDALLQQDDSVHPYPVMAMWGDYSNLRQVIKLLDSATSYSNLSPADKTTLHTAACTLGMLAYNLQYLADYNPGFDDPTVGPAAELNAYIDVLMKGSVATSALASAYDSPNGLPLKNYVPPSIRSAPTPAINIGPAPEPEDIIAGLEAWRDNAISLGADAVKVDHFVRLIHTAELLANKVQVWRDSQNGFAKTASTVNTPHPLCGKWGTNPIAYLCSDSPRYPILYSVFNSYKAVTGGPAQLHPEFPKQTRDLQDSPGTRQWDYISNVNAGWNYQPIDINVDTVMDQIALKPRPLSAWVLPKLEVAGAGKTPNSNQDVLIRDCEQSCLDYSFVGIGTPAPAGTRDKLIQVAFKDSALFNGREMMSVRTMDMNLGLMRTSLTNWAGASDPSNYWLPLSGVIYAFREDAVSESNIVRPRGTTWSSCNTNTKILTPLCRMDTTGKAYDSQDPPLDTGNSISPKPVDYYADPDRRPNAFRLRNGVDLSRPTDTTGRGLSLISDNPVYIQGDFNLHQDAGGNRIEEFVQRLPDNYNTNDFYTNRTDLDPKFADPTNDRWRPAEILADAISILSLNFCDGTVEDVMLTAGKGALARVNTRAQNSYNCQGNANITSYLNIDGLKSSLGSATIPAAGGNYWRRVDQAEHLVFRTEMTPPDPLIPVRSPILRSPILISQSGNPVRTNFSTDSEYTGSYYTTSDGRPRIGALSGTRINAILVSGLVPSRPNQSYGGLHNFPRFLEDWQNRNLYISGSFLQLNFSNYATAPFDQDAFEVGSTPVANELLSYYSAPNRRWGYDVGLQYAPAGPLAQRFITLKAIRSEFYMEPPADDPYIRNLCKVINPNPANCS